MMQSTMDVLCFDLMDFDAKHPIFPPNACKFIIEAASIPTPTDSIPTFDAMYATRVGRPNDFESVLFYSDFTRLMNSRY